MTGYDIIALILAIIAVIDISVITYDMYTRHSKKTIIIFSIITAILLSVLWFSKLYWKFEVVSIIFGILYAFLIVIRASYLCDLHQKTK